MVERGDISVRLWLWQLQSGHEEGGEPPLEVGQEDSEVVGGGGGAAIGTDGAGGKPHLAGDQLFEMAWKAGTGDEDWV